LQCSPRAMQGVYEVLVQFLYDVRFRTELRGVKLPHFSNFCLFSDTKRLKVPFVHGLYTAQGLHCRMRLVNRLGLLHAARGSFERVFFY